MRIFLVAIAACVTAACATGHSQTDGSEMAGSSTKSSQPSDNPSYDRGKALVEANCTSCHARFPGEASANPASPSFATLFRNYPPDYIAEAFAEGVFTGHNEMPAFEFTSREIDDLVTYLKTLERNDMSR